MPDPTPTPAPTEAPTPAPEGGGGNPPEGGIKGVFGPIDIVC